METQLTKRTKSLAWRIGGMVAVALGSLAISPEFLQTMQEADLAVPTLITALIGLVVNEITKALNTSK